VTNWQEVTRRTRFLFIICSYMDVVSTVIDAVLMADGAPVLQRFRATLPGDLLYPLGGPGL
jgi:hypothetical protein